MLPKASSDISEIKKLVLGLLCLLCVSFSNKITAQNQKTAIKKNAISFNILGASPVLGITYQRMIIPVLEAEVGLGLLGFGGGLKYYPLEMELRRYNPYVGLTYTTFDDFVGSVDIFSNQFLYIPLGLNFCGQKGVNFGFDIGPAIDIDPGEFNIIFYTGLKIGFRFGKKNVE